MSQQPKILGSIVLAEGLVSKEQKQRLHGALAMLLSASPSILRLLPKVDHGR